MWTTDLQLEGAEDGSSREFCCVLNEAIRDDDPTLLQVCLCVRVVGCVCMCLRACTSAFTRACACGRTRDSVRFFCVRVSDSLHVPASATAAQAVAPLIRAINTLCVVRGVRPDQLLRLPPDHVCYRGGGLPADRQGFFAAGQAYRVPGFLASSFSREVRLVRAAWQT